MENGESENGNYWKIPTNKKNQLKYTQFYVF